MQFRFYVVDFKKLNLKGITRFCNKFDCSVKMSVKINSDGIGIKLYDEKRNAGVTILDVHKLTDEDKEMVLGDAYDNEDLIEKVFLRCDHEFMIDTNSSDEVRLVYLFAMYIASCTDLILVNLASQQMLIGKILRDIDSNILEKYAKQYDIKYKYLSDIKRWTGKQLLAFYIPTVQWICLIFLSVVAVCLLMWMIFERDITNYWILGSPFITIGFVVLVKVFYNVYTYCLARKKLRELYFAYESELCELWEERMPKKPSGKIVGIKGKTINIWGILILPTLVIGSILIGLDFIVAGILIIIFPWISLIAIKYLVTDIDDEDLYNELFRWLEECFNQELPSEVVAVNYDLHELGNNEWRIDFVWCDKFEDRNSMWTKNNAREDGKKSFTFKYDASWEGVQEVLIKMIKKYLKSQERTIEIRLFKAMTVGFNDGIVYLIYKNGMIVQ